MTDAPWRRASRQMAFRLEPEMDDLVRSAIPRGQMNAVVTRLVVAEARARLSRAEAGETEGPDGTEGRTPAA